MAKAGSGSGTESRMASFVLGKIGTVLPFVAAAWPFRWTLFAGILMEN